MTLRIGGPGYVPYETAVRLEAAENQEVTAILQPIRGLELLAVEHISPGGLAAHTTVVRSTARQCQVQAQTHSETHHQDYPPIPDYLSTVVKGELIVN